MSDNIGQTNAEYSAEHRTVEERGETLQVAPRYPKEMLNAIAPLSDAEKLDYLYQVAVKVGALVDSITPAQVEQVKRMQSNPLMSKLFAGIIKG